MGVLACDRKGCENIMCDYYSPTFGYVCQECLAEMKDKAYKMEVEEFMDSDKKEPQRKLRGDRLEFIEQEFKSCYD